MRRLTRTNQETDAARQRGIFGSPTLVAGDEIDWGDDRLDAAIEHGWQAAGPT
ncbi:MAG TPA: hypothetical protein VLX44_16520 [Xanthobacteraceae bacterium]|nr:hypothetical protein [Xanthobacteraceae bacterium]